MSGLTPVAVYGIKVPVGEIMVPAALEFPATIRLTMAAIDPTLAPEADSNGNVPSVPRSTLKILKAPLDEDDDEDGMDEDHFLQSLIANASDDDEDEDEDEANGGPSDPAKSKRARREALKKLLEAAEEEDESDDEMEEADAKPNGSKKGKEKASDDDEDEDDDEDLDALDLESYVVCTLDTERTYQQPLDITIGENEKVFFMASGTHPIHLMGNYVMPDVDDDEEDEDEDDDDLYDLPPDMDELMDEDDDMSDELDHIDGAERVEELEDDGEEAPKLVPVKKGKNKRAAEDEAEGLDEMMAKDEAKLSKKQLKKLKNNKGEATAVEKAVKKESPPKGDKKVQFAEKLEQGPTGPAKKEKGSSVKTVNGVTIDDRKVGTGRTVKAGDKVGVRYIGKLQSGKVFDANKKGPAFSFKVGKGEVIKGWDIGVVGMAIGGERRLTIPAHLAYGSKGTAGIPGNSTLVFDVKLLEIK